MKQTSLGDNETWATWKLHVHVYKHVLYYHKYTYTLAILWKTQDAKQ